MKIYLFILSILFYPTLSSGQLDTSYYLDAELKKENMLIQINQKLEILNNDKKSIDTLFFNDWLNSYSDSATPLAQKLAEEFDRSFYLSSFKSRGRTNIKFFKEKKRSLKWQRLDDQKDIIYVVLKQPLLPSDSISISINYSINIPDSKFTGVGYKNNFIHIKDFIIALSPFNNSEWLIQSNLNLNDNSLSMSNYFIKWTYPKDYVLNSSMNNASSFSKENFNTQYDDSNIKVSYYKSKFDRSPKFVFSKENKISNFKTKNINIKTDLFKESIDLAQIKIDKIYDYLSKSFTSFNSKESYLITSYDYELRPLYGLNSFPDFLNPFDQAFIQELKFLKIFTNEYVKSQFDDFNFRKNHWLSEGLTIYLMIKYIEVNHPDQKLFGNLSTLPFIKSYSFSKLDFNKRFMMDSELMQRINIHQPALTSKENLVRYNERIATPYQVGILLRYIEYYKGKESFQKILNKINTVKNLEDFKSLLSKQTSYLDSENFTEYLNSIHTLDIKIKDVIVSSSEISVLTDQTSKHKVPYEVALIKDNIIIESKWVENSYSAETSFTKKNADYIAINPKFGLPEINKINNWRSLNSKILNKPLSIRFFKDAEDPKKNQLLISPKGFYSLYDGASFGAQFNNKTIGRRAFSFDIEPIFSSLENTIIGSVKTEYRLYNDSRSNYLTMFTLFGSSYHYSKNSLYKIAVPSIRFYFRPINLRSNLRHGLIFSWYSVQRESLNLNDIPPNYSLGEIKYQFSNMGSVDFFTAKNSIEIAKDFKKLILEIEFRKLFKSGRLFSARIFSGSFIKNRLNFNNYFDFNLNRPNDYLFKYSYLGRSETEGIFSQQFILNEGGFKSTISESSSNQWLLSTNISMGIWKWFEGYIDFSILKNLNQKSRSYYDYGFRLNFIPDYLELYFPIGSSEEYSLNTEKYFSKIRFVFSLNSKDIATFFSRRWF